MDSRRFDDWLRVVTDTRRTLLGASLLVILGRTGLSTTEAKKKRHKKKKKRGGSPPTCSPGCGTCQTCQNTQCIAVADGTACGVDGSVCKGGVCVANFCAGKNQCLASADCGQPGGAQCACFVAVGTGVGHCGENVVVQPCTVWSDCNPGETCVDLTGCQAGGGGACSPPCPTPL